MYAIIDIGSNTIRMCVYECDGKTFTIVDGKKTVASLAMHIENSLMSEEGMKIAAKAVKRYVADAKKYSDIKIYAFATASLRNVKNSKEAVEYIENASGIKVDLLSGEAEALYSFAGATYGRDKVSGAVIDMGGGSTEIVRFKDGKAVYAASFPEGSLGLYTKYVKDMFPTDEECKNIYAYLEKLISEQAENNMKADVLYAVGGTVRAVSELEKRVFSNYKKGIITIENIKKLKEYLLEDKKRAAEIIKATVPERLNSVLPGLLFFDFAVQKIGCKKIYISKLGVREGYLLKKASGK
ncbi:MAG: hypothetical protein IJN40_00040 [Clostridia bacterium]|nr:hypothetical protein [Clostridia bacterium]